MAARDGGGPKLRKAPGARTPRKSWGPAISEARSPRISGGAVSGGLGGRGGGARQNGRGRILKVFEVGGRQAPLAPFATFEGSARHLKNIQRGLRIFKAGQKWLVDHYGAQGPGHFGNALSGLTTVLGDSAEPHQGPPWWVGRTSEGGRGALICSFCQGHL